jgi:hypothetical protein
MFAQEPSLALFYAIAIILSWVAFRKLSWGGQVQTDKKCARQVKQKYSK